MALFAKILFSERNCQISGGKNKSFLDDWDIILQLTLCYQSHNDINVVFNIDQSVGQRRIVYQVMELVFRNQSLYVEEGVEILL